MKNFVQTKSALLVAGLLLGSTNLNAADAYELIEIGDLGKSPSFVYSVNNSNVVAGYSARPNATNDEGKEYAVAQHAFIARYIDGVVTYQDLGAIDNSNVSVELTNNGTTETSFFNQELTFSAGFSINNNNLVAGYSQKVVGSVSTNSSTNEQTAVWTPTEKGIYIDNTSGTPVVNEIPDLQVDELKTMRALSVNDNNIVVGYGQFNPENDVDSDGNTVNSFYDNAFLYNTNNDTVTMIPSVTNDTGLKSSARDVNNQGVVAGWAQKKVDNEIIDSVFYFDSNSSTEMVQLTLFNNESGFGYSWAVSDFGRIVGGAVDADNKYFTAFMHDINSQSTTDLGVLNENTPFAEAFDINDPVDPLLQGDFQVVGTSRKSTFPTVNHAFLYENNEMKDLNDLIDCNLNEMGNREWVLYEARSINNNGVIVGNGILNGVAKAFMLIPRTENSPALKLCPVVEVEKSGGGSFPVSFLLMFIPLISARRLIK